MELLLKKAVTYDYLLTGFVTSLIVGAIISGIIGIFIDRQKKDEAAFFVQTVIANERKHFEVLVATSHLGFFELDRGGQVTYVNRRWSEITGIPFAEAKAEGWLKNIHKTDRDRVIADFDQIIAEPGNLNIEFKYIINDDNFLWIGAQVQCIFSESGEAVGYTGTIQDITARRRAEDELRNNEERLRLALSAANQGCFDVNLRTGQVMIDPDYIRQIGYDQVPDLETWLAEVHPDDRDAVALGFRTCVEQGGPYAIEYRRRLKSGDWRWVRSVAKIAEWDAEQRASRMIGIYSNITEKKQIEEKVRIAAVAFETQEAMVVTDAKGVILHVNKAFTDNTGYTAEEIIGKTPSILKSGRHTDEFYREMWDALICKGLWQGEIWDRTKSGKIYPKWLTISAVKDALGTTTHYVGAHFDITEKKQSEARIENLAFYDQLTELPNRTLLFDRMKLAMTASSRNGTYAALLFIDLDNFKRLNETIGHETGDQLLKKVAGRLVGSVRDDDTVARLGGDEFLLMLVDLSTNQREAASQVEQIGEQILAALNQAYLIKDSPYHCTASIGATLFQGQVASEDLFKQSDLAMYKSKAAGGNALRFFDPEMEKAVMIRASLEADLRQALLQDQLLLHYQPQVIANARVTGAEALVRWQHPRRGMVSPSDFIPLAEETGLILPLGKWVLETACRQLAEWANKPNFRDLTIAVNVSAHQIRQPDFVEQLLAVVKLTGANPERLKLELTESMLVENIQDIIKKMHVLKADGIGFSLDDFGTGYSSLSYLKRLPLDQLKIDQSFVRDVLLDPNDAAIARTIVALAQSLGLGVIAEGVETSEQRDFLTASGCHVYQGYLFSRPLPVTNFETFISEDNDRSTAALEH